jgi:hypothetical protein
MNHTDRIRKPTRLDHAIAFIAASAVCTLGALLVAGIGIAYGEGKSL